MVHIPNNRKHQLEQATEYFLAVFQFNTNIE